MHYEIKNRKHDRSKTEMKFETQKSSIVGFFFQSQLKVEHLDASSGSRSEQEERATGSVDSWGKTAEKKKYHHDIIGTRLILRKQTFNMHH